MWCVSCWRSSSSGRFAKPGEERRDSRRNVGGARCDKLLSRSISPPDTDRPYTTRMRCQHIVNAVANHHGVVARDARVLQCRRQAFGFVTPLIARGSTMDRFEELIDRKVRQYALSNRGWLRGHHRKPVASHAKVAKRSCDLRVELIFDQADVFEALTIGNDRATEVIVIRVSQETLKNDAQRRTNVRAQLILRYWRNAEHCERVVQTGDDPRR